MRDSSDSMVKFSHFLAMRKYILGEERMSAKNISSEKMNSAGMSGSAASESHKSNQGNPVRADQGSVTKPMTGKLTPGHTKLLPYGHKGGSVRK